MKYKCKKCGVIIETFLDVHIQIHEREQKRKEYFEEIEE